MSWFKHGIYRLEYFNQVNVKFFQCFNYVPFHSYVCGRVFYDALPAGLVFMRLHYATRLDSLKIIRQANYSAQGFLRGYTNLDWTVSSGRGCCEVLVIPFT